MKNLALVILILTAFHIFAQEIKPPVAKRKDHVRILHNDTVHDYYYWMKDKNQAEFINYLYAENGYADRIMKPTMLLRKKIYEELRGWRKETYSTSPAKSDNYYYYVRYEEGKDYAIYCRKKDSLTAPEEIYLNGNELAKDFMYFNLSIISISPDHKRMVYGVDQKGNGVSLLFFKDIERDTTYEKYLKKVSDVVWAEDNKTIYFTVPEDTTLRTSKVYKLVWDKDSISDASLVLYEPDKEFAIGLGKTISKKYITIVSSKTTQTKVWLLKSDGKGTPKLFQKSTPNLKYDIDQFEGDSIFYVRMENEKFINGQIMTCPENNTSIDNWKVLIPHRENVKLFGLSKIGDIFLVSEEENMISRQRVINPKTHTDTLFHKNTFIESYSAGRKERDNDSILVVYKTSKISPWEKYEFNIRTKEMKLVEKDTLLKEYNPDNYGAKRIYATAKDGTKIPVTLMYKKGSEKKASPLLLNGYGAYGISDDIGFSTSILSYLNRGFIYAWAHVRGGGDLGKQWYLDGKLLKKKNTFTDFITCAEMLIDSGYTTKDSLVINGGSAGGLLMGAVVNMRPDLFKCVVAEVPFVDVLTTMLDTTLPLTTFEYEEWGNPNIKKYYDYIKSYSPYDNVEAKDYPTMLVTSGYNDGNVGVHEPAKWVAKLRHLKTDTNLLLFKVNMNAGHGGASGRYDAWDEVSFKMAFIMKALGIKEEYLTIKGKVTDQNGSPLPFVNIYVKGTSQGTTSNFDGDFTLNLQKGTSQTLVFQYVGFKKKEIPIDIKTNTSNLKVKMETEATMLHEVTVTADGRDPAYAIIKHAQKTRKKHAKQLKAYSVDIYIKSVDRLSETPEKLPKFMENWELPDSNDLGLLGLSESVAKYYFQAPDNFKEEMIASKVAGTNHGYSWNRAGDVMINFYQNNIPMGWFGERGFVSPIASSAMMYYKFKLVNIIVDNGKTIYKIQVIPRRKHDPVFKGYVYIVDGEWSFSAVDLVLTKDANIKMIDSLEIKQTNIPLNDTIWVPFTIQYKQHFKIFGYGGYSNAVGTFSNYNIHPHFDKNFFGNEIFRIEESANKKDTVYWDKTRYIKLTDEEKEYYRKKDSLLRKRQDPVYLDSLKKAENKFHWNSIWLESYSYKNYPKYRSWYIDALISPASIYYNTVEGLVVRANAGYAFYDKKDMEENENRMWFWNAKTKILPTLKYSITNNEFYGYISTYYKENINLAIGRDVKNIANTSEFDNTIYTLFLKENLSKFHKKDFVSLWTWRRITRGLTGSITLNYERRYPMTNNADFSFYDYFKMPDKEFTSNNPLNPDDDSPAFNQHDVFIASVNLSFQPGQKYESYPGGKKYYNESDKPYFYLDYKHGEYTSDSRSGFNFAQFAISDIINMNLFGKSVYTFNVGGFISGSKNLEFIDYKHFEGNQTIFLHPIWGLQSSVPFNTLNYFDYSTNKYYLSGRWEHHFNGWVFNKLPVLRKLKFQVLAGAASLYSADNGLFSEIFVGAENIFNVLRIDVVTNYQNEKINPLLRIGIDVQL